jgi:hypothetical protein
MDMEIRLMATTRELTNVQAGTEHRPTGAARGAPLLWLRLEGMAGLAVGLLLYWRLGGQLLVLIPLLLIVDVSMVGYLVGPRPGAFTYNLAHNWAVGLLVLGAGWALASTPLLLAGAILVGHVGMDRFAGYGLKYTTAFKDTHLGWLGR